MVGLCYFDRGVRTNKGVVLIIEKSEFSVKLNIYNWKGGLLMKNNNNLNYHIIGVQNE